MFIKDFTVLLFVITNMHTSIYIHTCNCLLGFIFKHKMNYITGYQPKNKIICKKKIIFIIFQPIVNIPTCPMNFNVQIVDYIRR